MGTADDTLLISEMFSSIQGEGVSLGKPSTFVRFYGCMFRLCVL